MQGSWIWHCINYLTITRLAWHWKQVWVFSWQYNPYFRISGLIWSFESLIIRRNIYVCVYIGIYIVESIFLPFSVGGVAFVLSAVRFLGAAGLRELGAVFCRQHRHRLQFSGFSGISWETCGWVGCRYSNSKKWSVCPAGLALPAPSQCWGRRERNTFSPPRAQSPTCLPLWGRKAWVTPILTSQFLSHWACGKKCPIYHPLCSSVREKHCSLPLVPCISRSVRKKRSEALLTLQPGAAFQSKTRPLSRCFSYLWPVLSQ